MRYFLLVLLLAVFSGCSDRVIKNKLLLNPTPVLNSKTRYVVIVSPYVRVSDTPYKDSISVSNLRKGDIQSFIGKEYIDDSGSIEAWINIESGWIKAENCIVCSSKDKAETAAALLLE